MDKILLDIFLIIFLFLGNIIINDSNLFFSFIYLFLILYHLYISNFIVKKQLLNNFEFINFLFASIFLYFITYFFVCDPNPFFAFLFYFIFYPDFIKGIIIIFIHTYFLSFSLKYDKKALLNSNVELNVIYEFRANPNRDIQYYFLSEIFKFVKDKKLIRIVFVCSILFLFFIIILFEKRIALWVYFNEKEKTLPLSYSKNRIFYITSNVVNIEYMIESYIEEMKKLINYLGYNNVIISIVENGDSIDNTRKYLENFENYLRNKKILNKFILKMEIEDTRYKNKPNIKGSRLRIEFYAKLRNKCFDYLYELPNVDFDNIVVIFFNDVIFKYEDIINLLSTNKEDFDSVCGLDMFSHYFYDRWVTIDLDGNGLKKYFPFFINKEAQDLILNHKPIRVFSCWNGVIAFNASSLKNKQIQFRHKTNYTIPKYLLNNPNKNYFESECTYFNIDLFSLGYDKKFINPDVKVSYGQDDYLNGKYFSTYFKHFLYSFILYFMGFCKKRNKLMSDYVNKNIKLNNILKNWYLENKKDKNN